MVTAPSGVQEQEPTADFNRRCLEVAQRWQRGELPFPDAVEQIKVLGEEAERSGHAANLARVEHLLGYMHGYRTNLNTSLWHFERARKLYERVGNRKRVAAMDLNMGETYRYKGDFSRARRLFHAAYETAGSLGETSLKTQAIANEGQMLFSMGQLEQARAALEEADDLARKLFATGEHSNMADVLCEVHHGLTMIFLTIGDVEVACQRAQYALSLARDGKEPMQIGFAHRAAGEVVAVLENPTAHGFMADADEYFRIANDAFRAINMEGESARTMLAHARSLTRRGKKITAARKLQQVMIIFTKLGMVDDTAKAAELQLAVL